MEHTILLVGDDPVVAGAIHSALADASDGPFIVEWARNLSDGLETLKAKAITAVFLELFLPDCQGISTFVKLSQAVPRVPIVILAGGNDQEVAKQALKAGAYDYLLKERLDSYSLMRALQSLITRKTVEDAMFLEKEVAQRTLNSIGDAVITTDISGKIIYLNQVAETMTGWSWKDAAGRPFAEVFQIVDGQTRELLQNPMELAVKGDQTVRLSSHCVLIRRDGSESAIEDSTAPIHTREGQITGAVMVFHDVGEAHAMALKMTRLAQHDLLTGLPNRLLLHDRITQAISLSRRKTKHLAVLFLDLDGFKQINDLLGHETGDKLLREIAKRAVGCVRASDTVSRLGGDEFVILLPEVADAGDAAFTAEKILAAIANPFAISGRELRLTGCIGISIYPEDGHAADALIKSADTAMYEAKDKAPGAYQFFGPKFSARDFERKSLARSLGRTPDREESISPHQQKLAYAGSDAQLRSPLQRNRSWPPHKGNNRRTTTSVR